MSQHGDYSGLPGFCDRDSNGEIIHYNVQCDGCKTSPIKGSRFKCSVCSNYDLCGQCESFGKHDPNHPMIKFNHSARNAVPPFMGLHEMMNQFGHGPHKWFGHHWKGRFCGKNRQRAQQQHVPQQHVPHNWWQHNQAHRGWRRYQNNNNNHNMYQQQGQYQWQQWCENRQNEQEPVISSNIANIKDAANKKIKVMADFVSDVTLPDRTYYPTDTVLTKTWKMRNNGEHEWGNNVELVFFKGNESLTLEKRYPVINAKPGCEVEVSAVIKTPHKPGRYCSYYRLQRNAEYFGPRVWVDIFAVDEQDTSKLNKGNNQQCKWKKYKNKNKNKEKAKNNDKANKDKMNDQDKMIKLEKKEAKLEAKQLKLEAKQSKLASKINHVSKQLDQQQENENSTKLVKKQEKLVKKQEKLQKQADKMKIKQQRLQQEPVIIDEQQLLDDIANAVNNEIKDLEQKQDSAPIEPPLSAISCVCGATLHKTSPLQAYSKNNASSELQVNCDICGKFCPPTAKIYHCPNLKSLAHPEGYDLCASCVEYQMQGFIPNMPQVPILDAIKHDDVVVPPPKKQQTPFKYQQQLEQLKAMGFNDEDKVKQELIKQKGNVQRAANGLI